MRDYLWPNDPMQPPAISMQHTVARVGMAAGNPGWCMRSIRAQTQPPAPGPARGPAVYWRCRARCRSPAIRYSNNTAISVHPCRRLHFPLPIISPLIALIHCQGYETFSVEI